MKNEIFNNTILGIDSFQDEIKKSIILHIPHSSAIIPDMSTYYDNLLSEISDDILKSTDWNTDEIFKVDGIDSVIFPYSRVYCDVERLNDDNEPNFKSGRGFYYTHSLDGVKYRNIHVNKKDNIHTYVYCAHQVKLNELVESKLEKYGSCLIIDCHSFSEEQLIDPTLIPDICLGTDEYHTPDYVLNYFKNEFEKLGFTVGINNPYSGSMVPLNYLNKDKRVKSILIEINKKLYLHNKQAIIHLNSLITNMLNFENYG